MIILKDTVIAIQLMISLNHNFCITICIFTVQTIPSCVLMMTFVGAKPKYFHTSGEQDVLPRASM